MDDRPESIGETLVCKPKDRPVLGNNTGPDENIVPMRWAFCSVSTEPAIPCANDSARMGNVYLHRVYLQRGSDRVAHPPGPLALITL